MAGHPRSRRASMSAFEKARFRRTTSMPAEMLQMMENCRSGSQPRPVRSPADLLNRSCSTPLEINEYSGLFSSFYHGHKPDMTRHNIPHLRRRHKSQTVRDPPECRTPRDDFETIFRVDDAHVWCNATLHWHELAGNSLFQMRLVHPAFREKFATKWAGMSPGHQHLYWRCLDLVRQWMPMLLGHGRLDGPSDLYSDGIWNFFTWHSLLVSFVANIEQPSEPVNDCWLVNESGCNVHGGRPVTSGYAYVVERRRKTSNRREYWRRVRVADANIYRTKRARLATLIGNGPPQGQSLEGSHRCTNSPQRCVNPRHMRWETHALNMNREKCHNSQLRCSCDVACILTSPGGKFMGCMPQHAPAPAGAKSSNDSEAAAGTRRRRQTVSDGRLPRKRCKSANIDQQPRSRSKSFTRQ